MTKKHYLDLLQFFEGYVRNYRRLNLNGLHNRSMMTNREIEYFANLGEMLGFDSFIEDSKFDKLMNRSRPMDLAWWRWDLRESAEDYDYLALHLERENLSSKDEDTIDKLFSDTVKESIPHNVIGIQTVQSQERIEYLNELVKKKNDIQQSNALIVYRYYDGAKDLDRISAYHFNPKKPVAERHAVCKQDEFGYWFMCFKEEYEENKARRVTNEYQIQ